MRSDVVRRLTERHRGLLSCLRTPRQRRLVSVLQHARGPMTVRDLAVQLAAQEEVAEPADVAPATLQRFQVSLRHVDLPRLEAAGLVEWQAAGYVVDGRLPPELSALVGDDLADGDERRWEAVVAMVSKPRRQAIVEVITDSPGPVALETLAKQVADRQAADGPPARTVNATELHHVDVPKLADVGLVEYDVNERSVAPGPVLPAVLEWLDDGGGRSAHGAVRS